MPGVHSKLARFHGWSTKRKRVEDDKYRKEEDQWNSLYQFLPFMILNFIICSDSKLIHCRAQFSDKPQYWSFVEQRDGKFPLILMNPPKSFPFLFNPLPPGPQIRMVYHTDMALTLEAIYSMTRRS